MCDKHEVLLCNFEEKVILNIISDFKIIKLNGNNQ